MRSAVCASNAGRKGLLRFKRKGNVKPDGLSLDEFLRYGFCGMSLLASAHFAQNSSPAFLLVLSSAERVAVITALAFACGAMFYSAYRACIYPVLGRAALFWVIGRKEPKIIWRFRHVLPTQVPRTELARDRFRWLLRDEAPKGVPRLFEWGSQIHLLYTLAFSLYLGSACGVTILSSRPSWDWLSPAFWFQHSDYRLVIIVCGLFFSGLFSDIRKRRIEEYFFERRCKLGLTLKYGIDE